MLRSDNAANTCCSSGDKPIWFCRVGEPVPLGTSFSTPDDRNLGSEGNRYFIRLISREEAGGRGMGAMGTLTMPGLFDPLVIRDLTFANRVFVSPMGHR